MRFDASTPFIKRNDFIIRESFEAFGDIFLLYKMNSKQIFTAPFELIRKKFKNYFVISKLGVNAVDCSSIGSHLTFHLILSFAGEVEEFIYLFTCHFDDLIGNYVTRMRRRILSVYVSFSLLQKAEFSNLRNWISSKPSI